MRNTFMSMTAAVVLGGIVCAGAFTSCDDDTNNNQTGVAGRGGTAGASGQGGSGTGGASTYNMRLDSAQEVPTNASAATANVTVILSSTGQVVVDGTFSGLTSMVTVAHIHGPAAPGANGPIIVPLTVSGTTSGTVSGTATMDATHMSDMINGMTYVNIHSAMYPSGEIRAQIVP